MQRSRPRFLALGLPLGVVAVALSVVGSMAFGAAEIPLGRVVSALLAPDDSIAHAIVRTQRLPRAAIAAIVGASLAVAGGLMQGITRNVLASPSILGVNAGAALAVVGAVFLFSAEGRATTAVLALFGAGAAAIGVYALGSLGSLGAPGVRLVLAGAAVTALLTSLTTAILLVHRRTLEEIRFWLAGSVAGRDVEILWTLGPVLGLGLAAALLLGGRITILSLGEDVARGLGQATGRVRVASALCVTLLAGGAVAIAGPVGFVGLVVPNAVRSVVGTDYRWILPYSAVAGACLLIFADVAARSFLRPEEIPLGVMTAVIGAPVFVALVRSGRAGT